MTQRFGRNKRRAARDAVAKANAERNDALNAQVKSNEAAVQEQRRAWRADALMREMALGDDSALLPLELMRVRRDHGPHSSRHPIRRGLDNFPIGPSDMSQIMQMVSHDEVSVILHRLITRVEYDPIRFARLIRFVSEQSEKPRGNGFSPRYYQISEMALQTIGFGRDVEFIARQIAEQLVNMPAKETAHETL